MKQMFQLSLGPGEHHPWGRIFLYFTDPDRVTLEYSQGMEEFPEEGAREARRFEPSKKKPERIGEELRSLL